MIALDVVVLHVLVDHMPQVPFAEDDQTTQALFLDRPHEPLRIGIEIGASRRESNRAHAGRLKQRSEFGSVQRIPIADQESLASQESVNRIRQVSGKLDQPLSGVLVQRV